MSTTVAHRPGLDEATRARRIATGLVVVLAAGAWVALGLWSTSPHARYLDHDWLADSARPMTAVSLFVAGWVVMLAAMMFPSTHDLVAAFSVVVRSRPDRLRLMLTLLAGYATVWTSVGLGALLGDQVLHAAVERVAWLDAHEWAIAAVVVAAAGGYQLSPLKDRCLAECRSPRAFVFARWRGRNAVSEAFAMGAGHARFCVGCCLALMLLVFAIGMGNLAWMLLFGAVMTAEKLAPWGRRLVRPVGLALPVVALVMVAGNV